MDSIPVSYAQLIDSLRAQFGERGVLTDPADTAPYCEDWRRLYRGRTPAVLRPATTREVADAVRLCAARGVPIVPQGGNTSMVGGAAVSEDGSQIVLSLSRLNRVRGIDPVDMTMEIEAGVTLKAAQDAAAEAGCLLPLSISSEGSAQIGGVLATNAGGNNTVRYGNARDLVLGLEVVLAGRAGVERPAPPAQGQYRLLPAPAVRRQRGHARHHHRRGAEAVSAAARGRGGAVRGPSPEAALDLFNRLQQHDRGGDPGLRVHVGARRRAGAATHPRRTLPFRDPAPAYVLVELATPREGADLRGSLESCSARRWRPISSPTR